MPAIAARDGSMSTTVTDVPGSRAQSRATSSPSTPAPTTAMRPAGPGAASHVALSAVSMLAASAARSGGRPSGKRHNIFGGKVKHGLVRIKREAEAALQVRRAVLDAAHHRVAIFYGKRE